MKTSKGSLLTNEQIIDRNTPQRYLATSSAHLIYNPTTQWRSHQPPNVLTSYFTTCSPYIFKQLNCLWIHQTYSTYFHHMFKPHVGVGWLLNSIHWKISNSQPTSPTQRQFHHVALHWVVTLMKTRTAPADSWNSQIKKTSTMWNLS